jgi:hypothetical protein
MLAAAVAVPSGLAYIARGSHRPVQMFRVITLTPSQASTFFWTFFVLSLVAAVIAVWVAVQSHTGPGYVELGPQAAVLPKASLSRVLMSVPYAAIREIRAIHLPGQQMIIVESSAGQTRVSSRAFATAADFALFLRALHERARARPAL